MAAAGRSRSSAETASPSAPTIVSVAWRRSTKRVAASALDRSPEAITSRSGLPYGRGGTGRSGAIADAIPASAATARWAASAVPEPCTSASAAAWSSGAGGRSPATVSAEPLRAWSIAPASTAARLASASSARLRGHRERPAARRLQRRVGPRGIRGSEAEAELPPPAPMPMAVAARRTAGPPIISGWTSIACRACRRRSCTSTSTGRCAPRPRSSSPPRRGSASRCDEAEERLIGPPALPGPGRAAQLLRPADRAAPDGPRAAARDRGAGRVDGRRRAHVRGDPLGAPPAPRSGASRWWR